MSYFIFHDIQTEDGPHTNVSMHEDEDEFNRVLEDIKSKGQLWMTVKGDLIEKEGFNYINSANKIEKVTTINPPLTTLEQAISSLPEHIDLDGKAKEIAHTLSGMSYGKAKQIIRLADLWLENLSVIPDSIINEEKNKSEILKKELTSMKAALAFREKLSKGSINP